MKDQIKQLRVQIDGLAQLTKELKPIWKDSGELHATNFNSKEIEKAVDSLYLAKAWLGKILGELGNENPYGSGYKTKEDIVPTQDVNISIKEVFEGSMMNRNHIEKVDWLRSEIKNLIERLPDYLKWTEEQIDNFYKTVEEYSKEDFCKKEEEFMSSLPNLDFEFNLVYKYLSEARFWLGFELERLKNEE